MFGLAVGLVFCIGEANGGDFIIWDQPAISKAAGDPYNYALSSSIDAHAEMDDGTFAEVEDNRVYDNFKFTRTVTITDIHWTGTYDRELHPETLDGFKIDFWADSTDNTGPALMPMAHFDISGNADESWPNGVGGFRALGQHSYNFVLPGPGVIAQAGQTYWVSIMGLANAQTDEQGLWQWSLAQPTPNSLPGLYQDQNDYGDAFVTPGEERMFFSSPHDNVAFKLTGRAGAIPEPAGVAVWTLLLTVCGGIGLLRRRRKQCLSR